MYEVRVATQTKVDEEEKKLYMVKRDGRQESVHFDKITSRLEKLMAARIAVSNMHKDNNKSFSEIVKYMCNQFNERSGLKASLIAKDVYDIIMKNPARLDSDIIYDQDFDYDFLGFKTLERSYLLKVQGKVVERPQHMLMRISIGIHQEDVYALRTQQHRVGGLALRQYAPQQGEVAHYASAKLVEADPENSAGYVMLANAFAGCRKWGDVAILRTIMREKGVRKQPGNSWISIDGNVHEFVAGMNAHSRIESVYQTLDSIFKAMRLDCAPS